MVAEGRFTWRTATPFFEYLLHQSFQLSLIALLRVKRQRHGVVAEPEKYAVVRARAIPVMTTTHALL
jgi:hypothetical protein